MQQEDVCAQKELKTSEGDNVLQQETCELEEKLQTEGSEGLDTLGAILEALQRENMVLSDDMFEKLTAEKAHKEAIKEELFKKIQALNIKVRQQQDTVIQQKVKASEREKMLSLKPEELEEKRRLPKAHCQVQHRG